jgi:predicted transcriptional regulator
MTKRKRVSFTVTLSKEGIARLGELAEALNLTRSRAIESAVEKHLQQLKPRKRS